MYNLLGNGKSIVIGLAFTRKKLAIAWAKVFDLSLANNYLFVLGFIYDLAFIRTLGSVGKILCN